MVFVTPKTVLETAQRHSQWKVVKKSALFTMEERKSGGSVIGSAVGQDGMIRHIFFFFFCCCQNDIFEKNSFHNLSRASLVDCVVGAQDDPWRSIDGHTN
jgi:hypothetical protein